MPGTLTPAQDYDHVLNIISGSDGMHDLQFTESVTTDSDCNSWNRGSIVCTDNDYLGGSVVLWNGGWDACMPLWAINATYDLDVNSDIGNFNENRVTTIVATGGYEIFTTEFVPSGDGYVPNEFLTWASGTDWGRVKPASFPNYNDTDIVGCVSRGITTDVYGQEVLNFWTMFIPSLKAIPPE